MLWNISDSYFTVKCFAGVTFSRKNSSLFFLLLLLNHFSHLCRSVHFHYVSLESRRAVMSTFPTAGNVFMTPFLFSFWFLFQRSHFSLLCCVFSFASYHLNYVFCNMIRMDLLRRQEIRKTAHYYFCLCVNWITATHGTIFDRLWKKWFVTDHDAYLLLM